MKITTALIHPHELIFNNSEIVKDNYFGNNELVAMVCERKIALQMDVQLLKHIFYIQFNLLNLKRFLLIVKHCKTNNFY